MVVDALVLSPYHLVSMTSSERTTFRPFQRYEQIAERLADDIRSGVLTPGEPLSTRYRRSSSRSIASGLADPSRARASREPLGFAP
jgi:hypothetical protein